MARIQHIAIASLDPERQADFYKKVFGFQEVKRLDNPRATGVVLTDGAINISVLKFHQDQIDHGLDFTGLHHFGVFVEDLEGTAQRCLDHGAVPYVELPEDAGEKGTFYRPKRSDNF
jgi:catechol 2,3-dioxygenase-like lactoylglutathione lyase family enzyme